jgi:hypothetical protein
MIIYKGWGIAGIGLPGPGALLMLGLASLFKPSNAVFLKFALAGVLTGAVGAWFLG